MISTRLLTKTFGFRPILRGLNLDVAPGECVALLGPNGAGKTTLIRILATLARPTLGQVTVAGFSLPSGAAEVRRRLGVVTHHTLLYTELTAEENLIFYARLYGLGEAGARISQVLAQVGLEKRRRDLVRTYSRGMQQRLSLARALLPDPEVMLFDEPYTGLDPDATRMLDEVLRVVVAQGRTVLLTTHDLPRALALSHRVLILNRGVIAHEARSTDLTPAGLAETYASIVH
jgi:heme exporter protein A